MATIIAVRDAEPWRRRLFLPAYTVADAARYAKTKPQTVSYWHFGGPNVGPALPGREHRRPLSYLELIEAAFVSTFRRLGLSLQKIRRAREYAAQALNSEFPFAEYKWKTEGQHMLLDLWRIEPDSEAKQLILGDVYGQVTWQGMVGDRFAEFDYEDELALIWHVAGRQSRVTIDPRVAFGAPMVSGIATWVLKGRWKAGECIEDIEEDFTLDKSEIVQGLQFEGIKVGV
jgi:uncharacterized protein (DUF433 family)